jgi:hypothetical protein
VSSFRPLRAPTEMLLCIWQTLPLVASSFAIVPKSWRPFADHVWESMAGSGSFLICRSRCQAFRPRRSGLNLYAKPRRSARAKTTHPVAHPQVYFWCLN